MSVPVCSLRAEPNAHLQWLSDHSLIDNATDTKKSPFLAVRQHRTSTAFSTQMGNFERRLPIHRSSAGLIRVIVRTAEGRAVVLRFRSETAPKARTIFKL